MPLPEIRIKKSGLLIDALSPWMRPVFEKDGYPEILDSEFLDGKVKEFTEAWEPYERKILSGMCGALGLEFRQNYIDVYVAPFGHSFSDPMVIASKTEADRVVEILTHEILHRLLTDNTKVKPEERLADEWWRMYGKEHSFVTVIHIPVHALMKYIFLDLMKEPKRYERDVLRTQNYKDYRLAWDYVDQHDYRDIIHRLEKSYKEK